MPELSMKIEPGRLSGKIVPPPSKSDAHRALICSGLAGSSLPEGLGTVWSDDIEATRSCLRAILDGEPEIDCRESGTTLRLLVPVAAALGRQTTFVGRGRLPFRPMREYVQIFAGHETLIDMPGGASLPLSISGHLASGRYLVPGHISSQYISGLLLALPLLRGDSEIVLTSSLQSAPYVNMTRKTMAAYGVKSEETANGFFIYGGQSYKAAGYRVEADYSQAAFWLTAAFAGSEIEVTDLPADSVQGDRAIIKLLADFKSGNREYQIDVAQIPDLVPVLALAAAMVPARTRLINAARLRLKESDRLLSTEAALRAIGINIKQDQDGLTIEGGHPIKGGRSSAHNDHRIAMALAIAGLSSANGVIIEGAQSVNKSYPDFFDRFRELGGKCYELNLG